MLAINIEDLRLFTNYLFNGELFDEYFIKSAEISTGNTFTINGKINASYYEGEEVADYSFWKEFRPLCFNLIKGKRLPVSFKIVLKLGRENLKKLIEDNNLSEFKDKLEECFLNIGYEDKTLLLTTGVFINEFVLDKSAEKAWDAYVLKLLEDSNIKYINS
jgi:hypothetical protein